MLRDVSLLVLGTLCVFVTLTPRVESAPPTAVVCAKDAGTAEKLAAKEVRRYVYLRTGILLPIVEELKAAPHGGVIVVGKGAVQALGLPPEDLELGSLQPEQYLLKTVQLEDRPVLAIVGGDAIGTLYGAYRLAEHLGVRFYLHGDVVPDQQIALELPTLDETRQAAVRAARHSAVPRFSRGARLVEPRRLQGHSRPVAEDGHELLRAAHLSRRRRRAGAAGLDRPARGTRRGRQGEGQLSRRGTSPPTAIRPRGAIVPGKTSDYVFGAAEMFDRDDYGADYMRDTYPWNKMSPEQCNALFDRMGEFLGDVFSLRSPPGHQDLHRHGNAADGAHGGQAAIAGGGQEPGRSGRRAGAVRGHVPAHRQRFIRWTTTGSGRPKAGPGKP